MHHPLCECRETFMVDSKFFKIFTSAFFLEHLWMNASVLTLFMMMRGGGGKKAPLPVFPL